MKIRGLIMLAAVVPLVGCQTAEPTSDVATQARIAAAVPTNYRQEALTFLRGSLARPDGIQGAEISSPMLGPVNGGQSPLVCVRLNSRDASGSFTGMETLALIFQDGRIIDTTSDDTPCLSAVYGPFFEPRPPA